MKAESRTLSDVLHGNRQFVVPVYQRPYVWEQDRQWEPLWQDVEATARRLLEARLEGHLKGLDPAQADQSAAPHFLGAIVLELKPTVTGAIEERLVVDGQQRLTTVQLLLRGVLDALEGIDADPVLRATVRKAILNDHEVVKPEKLRKVAPRRAELDAFDRAMGPDAPSPDDSNFAAARVWFATSASSFLADDKLDQDPYEDDESPSGRASLLVSALLGLVKLVVIDLEDVDDAQVIFEALNARNTPLSATDLVKNLLFLRAPSLDEAEHMYANLWKRFDDDADWWLESIGIGHAQRPRQDWLLGDWLIAERARAINVGRLYGEFRSWLDATGTKSLDALQSLSSYADAYEAMSGRRPGASPRERRAFANIEALGITVASPVLLHLMVQAPDVLEPRHREAAILAVEAFVIRRMAAKFQTRAYGQVFVEVLKATRQEAGTLAERVIAALRAAPHGYEWPSSDAVAEVFRTSRFYGPGGISQGRLRLLFGAIDARLQEGAAKSEPMSIDYDALSVEHVIPRGWRETWPVVAADEADRLLGEQDRDAHVDRIGNLTLVTGSLNSTLSNDPWATKRAQLGDHSKLQLNALLISHDQWDEARIVERGAWLADRLDEIWPGPSSTAWDLD